MDNDTEKLEQYDYIDDDFFDKAVKKYSEALGKFFMEFSDLEHELNITIADIICEHSHDLGYQIMERMSMRNKIDLFYRLFAFRESHFESKEKSKLRDIKVSLIDLNNFRNLLAHANWKTIQKDGSVRTRFISDKNSGCVEFKKIIIKPKDIRANIKEIYKLTSKLYYYREKTFGYEI